MWNSIIGHTEQIARLRKACDERTLAQTLLFAGPEGVGKYRIARTLAKTLFCNEARSAERTAQSECTHCTRIEANAHPDVLQVSPDPTKAQAEILIGQIRAAQAQLQLHPLEGNFKVLLIDRADTMRPEAANACLKLLEEPPEAALCLLISARPDRLLPTIRSRCQTITFAPLPTSAIRQYLEHEGMEASDARQRAELAEGSLGKALAFPIELLGETVQDLHHLLGAATYPDLLTVAQRWSAEAPACAQRLHITALIWRDALVHRLSNTETKATLPATQTLLGQLAHRPPLRLQSELETLQHTADNVQESTMNKQLHCESLLIALANPRP